jgi:mRNA-degrading endonuclease RelE of RelBE toxin-antitoxin system
VRTIVFTPEAAREFEALDSTVRERVEAALDQLAVAPLSLRNQIKRLKGQTALRLRVDWRIIFQLRGDEILVLMIAHRSEASRYVSSLRRKVVSGTKLNSSGEARYHLRSNAVFATLERAPPDQFGALVLFHHSRGDHRLHFGDREAAARQTLGG